MLAVRCTAVESNFCFWMSSIMLSGGAGGMTDAGRLTDAVDSSSTASWFSINSSCSFRILAFPSLVQLRQTSSDFLSLSLTGLSLLLR